MIRKYIESVFSSLKTIVNVYPIFVTLLGLEVLYIVLGLNQYSLMGLFRSLVNNFENAIKIDFILKLIISIISSVIVYISISFFIIKRSYNKVENVGYKSFSVTLWFKYIVVMIIVLVPLMLITEIIDSNVKIEGFTGYLLTFSLISLKSTAFFYIIHVINKYYLKKFCKVSTNNSIKQTYMRIGAMYLSIIIIFSPISYYLGNLEHILFIQNSNMRVVVYLVNLLLKTFRDVYIFTYIFTSLCRKNIQGD